MVKENLKSFKKDVSVYQYYDSTLFCCKEFIIEKRLQTLKNNPEIWKKTIEKLKQTIKDHPEIIEKSREKYKQTYKSNIQI